MNSSEKEVGIFKRGIDKLLRKFTGKYEETKRNELDRIIPIYKSIFDDLPEVFNLGEEYDNRLELSTQSYRLEYWTPQLKGHFFDFSERMINTMCSYEISKLNRFASGYSDEPVHLLFYVIKKWIVELSNTHFDIQDLETAAKWQKFIKTLIVQNVFVSSHQDNRVQVLFSLEKQLRTLVIPALSYRIEHNSALIQLQSTQAHLTKFFNHVFKYLFYIARDSKYMPNFDYYKLFAIAGIEKSSNLTYLTQDESKAWESLKNTVPIKLLIQLIAPDFKILNRSSYNIVPMHSTNQSEIKNNFHWESLDDMRRDLNYPFNSKNEKMASHINLHVYVNVHVFLKELIFFMQLFNSAQYCAEMGGNLLVYGVLGNKLIYDITDCMTCLQIIFDNCKALETSAWQAYEDAAYSVKDNNLNRPSNDWIDNYSQSGISYFQQLEKEFHLARQTLSLLAAAVTKKSLDELIDETKKSMHQYIELHNQHSKHRAPLLNNHTTVNHTLSVNVANNNAVVSSSNFSSQELYKKAYELCRTKLTINEGTQLAKELVSRASEPSAKSDTLYYSARFYHKVPDGKKDMIKLLNQLIEKSPGHIKGRYRLSQYYLTLNNYEKAKEHCDYALDALYESGLSNTNMTKKLKELSQQIVEQKSAAQGALVSNN